MGGGAEGLLGVGGTAGAGTGRDDRGGNADGGGEGRVADEASGAGELGVVGARLSELRGSSADTLSRRAVAARAELVEDQLRSLDGEGGVDRDGVLA